MPSARGSIQFARRGSLLVLLAAAIFLGAACKKSAPIPGGDITAALSLPIVASANAGADAAFDATTLKGKPTLVVFASPTCGHCLAELPVAQAVAGAAGANVLAVFVVGGKQQAAAMVARAKFTATALVDTAGQLLKKYDIKAVPYTLVLGPDGQAREAFRGEQDADTLRSALASAR